MTTKIGINGFGRIGRLTARVMKQRGDEIERRADAGEFAKQRDHPVVVLQGVQTHPRQAIEACRQILVVGLVHVPKERQPDFGFCHIMWGRQRVSTLSRVRTLA